MSPMQRELWDYVAELVACEKRRSQQRQVITQKRQIAAQVLCDPMRSDESAIKTARLILSLMIVLFSL